MNVFMPESGERRDTAIRRDPAQEEGGAHMTSRTAEQAILLTPEMQRRAQRS